MTLAAPLWLAVSVLALAILALHMRRRRHLEIPSIFLWRLLERSGAPHRTLRRPPFSVLLVLQILIVGLAALALAHPLLGGTTRPTHRIYVLDASASMRATDVAPTRFAAAVGALRGEIARTDPESGQRISVLTITPHPHIWIARQTDPRGMLPTVDGLAAGDGNADWRGATMLIRSVVKGQETTEIVLLTDGSDAGADSVAKAFDGVTVKQLRFGTSKASNAGLLVSVKPVKDADPGNWQVEGEVLFDDDTRKETTVGVLFRPAGSDVFLDWTEFKVDAPKATEETQAKDDVLRRAAFSEKLKLPGAGTLQLRLPDDDGPADNQAQFILRDAPRLARVLYLGNGNPPLLRALDATDTVDIYTADTAPVEGSDFDLVIVDGVTVAQRPSTNVLWLGSGRVASEPAPTSIADAFPSGWVSDHTLSADVNWGAVTLKSGYGFGRLPGADVFLESARMPLVQARTTPTGREVRIAFDLGASDWTGNPSFPVFIGNLIDWLGADFGESVARTCSAGLPCRLEARLLWAPILSSAGETVWTPPASTGWLLPATARTFIPDRAGLYRVPAGVDSRIIAVNAPAGPETALTPSSEAIETTEPSWISRIPPIWWLVLAVVLALVLLEAWLAGRGPEQFLRRSGLARTNPLANRRRLLLALRIGAVAFIVAALVGLPTVGQRPAVEVVLVAGSGLSTSSTGPPLAKTERILAGHGARAGLVQIGAHGTIKADIGSDERAFTTVAGPSSADMGANLENALALAAAMVPADRRGHIVLTTDANETGGEMATTLPFLTARKLVVDTIPEANLPPGEVLVAEVNVPDQIRAGESFPLTAVVYSQAGVPTRVSVLRDSEVITTRRVNLLAGRNRVEADVTAGEAGRALYEVATEAQGDPFSRNNRGGVIAEIALGPKIAVITPDIAQEKEFIKALAVQGLKADPLRLEQVPWKIKDWLKYDAFVLMNMPALDLDTRQLDLLKEAVEVHGRALLLLGGDNTFGPGGYYQTPLETLSPLSSRVSQESPAVALAFVLDRSGSMQAGVQDISRLDIAKGATLGAIELLNPDSEIAVVAFDTEAHVIAPIGKMDEETLRQKLAPVVPGGGTSLYPAVVEAFKQLQNATDVSAKHMVVMSDGLSQPGDFATLLKEIRGEGITVSAVAIGSRADLRRLDVIARDGGGAFYATEDFRALPSILSMEALLMEGSPVEKGRVPVLWVDKSPPFLNGLPESMLPIHGYVRTTLKDGATLHLAVIDQKKGQPVPLMASWRFGNGRVLALATDGAGPGSEEWMTLPNYPLLWAQVIRQFSSATQRPGLNVDLERNGDSVGVTADVLDDSGEPVSGLSVAAAFADADANNKEGQPSLKLVEGRPGRYTGAFSAVAPGVHSIEVTAGDRVAYAAVNVAYPARFDFSRAERDKLVALSAATGGEIRSIDAPLPAPGHVWTAQSGRRAWILAALALLMVDLAVRHVPTFLRLRRRRQSPSTALAVPPE